MEKVKKLLSFGSSTTYGMDLKRPKDHQLSFEDYRLQNCYSGILANRLRAENLNINALPGYSTESLYRVLVSAISDHLKTHKKLDDLYILIAMPPITPTELYLQKTEEYHKIFAPENGNLLVLIDENNIPKYSDPLITEYHAFFYKNIFNVQYGLEKYFLNLVAMQSFLKSFNIRHLIFSSSPIVPFYLNPHSSEFNLNQPGDLSYNKEFVFDYMRKNGLLNLVNTKNFFEFNENSIYEECKLKNKFKVGRTGHILEEGHLHWANHLWSFING